MAAVGQHPGKSGSRRAGWRHTYDKAPQSLCSIVLMGGGSRYAILGIVKDQHKETKFYKHNSFAQERQASTQNVLGDIFREKLLAFFGSKWFIMALTIFIVQRLYFYA